jgi:diguanylate cyclase (GGDEF)-like protein
MRHGLKIILLIKAHFRVLLTITVGYLLVLFALAFLGAELDHDVHILESSAYELYKHPFQVNKAAHEARIAAFGIRTEMLRVLAIRDLHYKHKDLPQKINDYSEKLDQNINIIEANFLGDMNRIHEVKKLIVRWKQQRIELVNLLQHHKDNDAEKFLTYESSPTYEQIDSALNYVVDYSNNKANFFADKASQQSNTIITQLNIFLAGFALLTLFAGGFTIVVVLRSLQKRDIQLAHKHEHIEHLAHYDVLTGLPNRALFLDRLHQSIALAKRNEIELALMFMDLDGFKKINDTLGHHSGDLLLIAVSERLKKCVRESDTLARLGGDEFTITLSGIDKVGDISMFAQKVIDALSVPFDLEGNLASIGISIGIAAFSEQTNTADRLINRADAAMYKAKLAGKNTYRIDIDD